MNFVNDRLTAHFRLSEFGCHGDYYISPDFITFVTQVLEPFRIWYNRPITINSGYRTAAVNAALPGSVKNSLHLQALAVDFNLPPEYKTFTVDRQNRFISNVWTKWRQLCRYAGKYGEMCRYDGYIHLGMRADRHVYRDKRGK